MGKRSLAVVIGLLAVIVMSLNISSAWAHTSLIASNPDDGSLLDTFPTSISLEFSEPLLAIGEVDSNYFEVRDESGRTLNLENFELSGAVMAANVMDRSAQDGRFEVFYRAVSADGHVIRGALSFSVGEEVAVGAERAVENHSEDGNQSRGSRITLGSLILLATFCGAMIYRSSPRKESADS